MTLLNGLMESSGQPASYIAIGNCPPHINIFNQLVYAYICSCIHCNAHLRRPAQSSHKTHNLYQARPITAHHGSFIHILVFQHLVSNDQSLHGSENTHNLTSFTGAKYSTRGCETLFNIIRAQNPHYHGQPHTQPSPHRIRLPTRPHELRFPHLTSHETSNHLTQVRNHR